MMPLLLSRMVCVGGAGAVCRVTEAAAGEVKVPQAAAPVVLETPSLRLAGSGTEQAIQILTAAQ